MKTLFISDLHLSPDHSKTTELFLNFMEHDLQDAGALYILGDFFEAWIGDDDRTPYHQTIKTALKKATEQGIRIYMMHGNRDFLLGERFMRETGCQLLAKDLYVIDLYGQPTLIMHGDTLCTADVPYQEFRKKIRGRRTRILARLLPLFFRRAYSKRMRRQSGEKIREKTSAMMDVVQADVENIMREHQVQHLIHGHTHKPGVHHFDLDGKPATRTVLGAWEGKSSVLICTPNSQTLLET